MQTYQAQTWRLAATNAIGIAFGKIDGTISYANEAFLRIVQFTQRDVAEGNINWRALTPREFRAADERAIEELENTGACEPYEKEYCRRDGSRVQVLVGAALIDAPDQCVGFVLDLSERKGAQAELQRRVDEFAALYDASQELATQQNVPQLLEAIVARAKDLLHVSAGAVMVYDAARNDLELAVVNGVDVPIGTRIAMGEGLTGQVAQTRQPRYINHYRHSPERSPRFDQLRIASMLSVPMLSGGDLIGVLGMTAIGAPHQFTDADVHLLSLFAAQAAVALRNARLLDEMRKRTQALMSSEARIRRLVDSNIIGVFFWRADGGISYANEAFLQMVGYTRDDLVAGKLQWAAMTPPEFCMDDERALEELRATGRSTPYEKEFLCRNGGRLPALVGGALFEDSQDQGVGFVLDLTERRRVEGRVRYLAQHDVLTGLPNRLVFQDRLELALAQARRDKHQVAVLFIDIDHFKHVNDSLGHQVGDRLLQDVARRLHDCLREGDSIARLGGDEFVICLAPVEAGQDAALVAHKVLEALAQPALVDGHDLYVTASVGIGLYPGDGADAEALMRAADTAMYHAKEKGKNNYQFFTAALNEAAMKRLTIANQLHRALEREELELHYQPQVDMKSGRILEAEVLLRWRRQDNSLVPPDDFVRIAEETGLIEQMGEWVLRHACERLRQWQDAGHRSLRMAINISPRQLRRPGFPELVRRILHATGVPASAIVLEITEGILMTQSEENLTVLDRLTEIGVRLAVDDFGVGYSSLAYLQRFPIHTLKIDRSFVSGISDDPNDSAIVVAIIAMARSLHLDIVAEGVETAEQATFLKRHGCRVAQGYYYGRPLPEQAFDQALRIGGCR